MPRNTNYVEKSLRTMTTNRSTDMNTLYEALSRARMLLPRDEAPRPSRDGARRVAMSARAAQARALGDQLAPRM
jgi:hypothetical protein